MTATKTVDAFLDECDIAPSLLLAVDDEPTPRADVYGTFKPLGIFRNSPENLEEALTGVSDLLAPEMESISRKDGIILLPGYEEATEVGWELMQKGIMPTVKVFDIRIEKEAGKLMKKYLRKNNIFLEVGCGDMSLRKYLPNSHTYNAMDISLADFHLQRVLPEGKRINVVIASVTKIPLPSNSVSMIAATEVLEHIINVNKAMSEIERVLKPRGVLIVSIPNNYCYKYQIKGAHTEHVQNWDFKGFIKYAEKYKFQVVESFMKGYWVPLPLWLTRTSYQLPFTSKEEFYNTNFFYVFRKL